MLRRRYLFWPAVATSLLLLAACSASTAAPSATSSGTARQGGTFTYIAVGDPNDLSPLGASEPAGAYNNAFERYMVYDALDRVSTNGAVQMRLAQAMTSSDGIHWTIVLRPNVKFSDGTPLDAAAVKFVWDFLASPANKIPVPAVASIASTTVKNARTLSVVLKAPNFLFPALVSQSPLTFIFSPTAYRKEGGIGGLSQKPVGAGPFTLKSWVRNSQLTFARNPNYYGKAYLDQVVIKIVPDATAAYGTLVSGAADSMWTQDPSTATRLKSAGYGDSTVATSGGATVLFNEKIPPFNDPLARQAIAYAFDSQSYDEALFNGTLPVVASIFSSNSPYYDPSVKQIQPDATKAQQLFNELAAKNGGKPLTFSIDAVAGSQTPFSGATAQWIQARLLSFKNVAPTLNLIAGSAYIAATVDGSYQLGVSSQPRWSNPYPTLYNWLTGKNVLDYSSAPLDAALARAVGSQDPAVQKAAYATAQKIITSDVPLLWTTRSFNYNFYSTSTVGALPVFSDGIPDMAGVWMKRG